MHPGLGLPLASHPDDRIKALQEGDQDMATLTQDLRFGMRQMRRSPGFAATVILTMALGIGANAVVFGILNALVLRPLDLPMAHQLYFFNQVNGGQVNTAFSYPDYLDLRERNSTLQGLTAARFNRVGVEYGGVAARTWFTEASGNYFDVLGVKPYLGRFFHETDEHGPNSAPYAVIAYDEWKTMMNGDVGVVGKVIELNKQPYTILGIAPKNFVGTELFAHPGLWVPMVNEEKLEGGYKFLESRGDHGLWLVGRLKPDVTRGAAESNLNTVAAQLAKQYQQDETLNIRLAKPGLLGDLLGGPVRAFLYGVMLLAGLVLLAACANLASLFAARAGDRARELAVRLALGSTRGRILRQLVVESLLLSVAGGAAGLALGRGLLAALSQLKPPADMPVGLDVHADLRVTLLALGLSVICGMFFGLAPGWSVIRRDSYQVIKSGAVKTAGGRRWTLRDGLLLLQIVLCSILVTSSLVSVRGLSRSMHANFGFVPANVTLATFDLKMGGYTDEQVLQFQKRVLDEAAAIPGVEQVGIASRLPLGLDSSTTSIYRDGTTDLRPSNAVATANYYEVSPGYIKAAKTRLIAGRDFTWEDKAGAPQVALINQTLARLLYGSADPVGNYLIRGDRIRVIGVVEDGKYTTLNEDQTEAIYMPLAQSQSSTTVLLARAKATAGADPEVAAGLQRLLHGLDPGLPLSIGSWQQGLGMVLFPAIAATLALGTMGLLAAMLALTGIFGMASYSVSRRLRELGIRMALGAARRQILRAAIGRPMQLLVIGSVLGLAAGGLANKLLAAIVYQATSRDPLVLIGVVVSMAAVGALAAWVPARRALGIQPSRLLREE